MLASLGEASASSQGRAGHTAGELVEPGVPRVPASGSVGECRALIRRTPGEQSLVAVVEAGRLLGLVPAGRLLRAGEDEAVGGLLDGDAQTVTAETTVEAAVERLGAHADVGIAVAAGNGRFLGVVPPARILSVLLAEHAEDMARLGGYRAGSSQARRAAEEPLVRRLWHRLPWLLVGLAGAMASVLIVGAFESQLDDKVLLAFFVPAVVYMADSVGTQTETLLIRALAADVQLGRVVVRELLTGVALGAAVAVLFYPFALAGWGDGDLAAGVSLALLCSCSIATAVAMALPIGLRRLGFDPAFGSGPLATVVQDLLSIAIYFAIAVPLAT